MNTVAVLGTHKHISLPSLASPRMRSLRERVRLFNVSNERLFLPTQRSIPAKQRGFFSVIRFLCLFLLICMYVCVCVCVCVCACICVYTCVCKYICKFIAFYLSRPLFLSLSFSFSHCAASPISFSLLSPYLLSLQHLIHSWTHYVTLPPPLPPSCPSLSLPPSLSLSHHKTTHQCSRKQTHTPPQTSSKAKTKQKTADTLLLLRV